jgi:hypothetical protein
MMRLPWIHALYALSIFSVTAQGETKIDRHALVERHSPTITVIDSTAPFMVGNGEIAFTADITGLQTFREQYSPRVPLMTQAQWAWHSFPNPKHYQLKDALTAVDVRGKTQLYPWLKDWSEAKNPAIAWLRENPHRFSLGRVSLYLQKPNNADPVFSDLQHTKQKLDLWNGALHSQFEFDGVPVEVETRVHPDLDMLIVTLRSALLREQRLGVDLAFPGVS